MCFVTNPSLISRAHFARYLVSIGIARDVPGVFQHYLTPGKPGYVDHRWATLDEAVGWINGAGGVAVVAHPGRYKMSGARCAFSSTISRISAGGHRGDLWQPFARPRDAFRPLARHYEFHASRGSDFHGPEESYVDLGRLPQLPEDLKPVWRLVI
jgi:predicted metal-dependent phosphoesterase TrpH